MQVKNESMIPNLSSCTTDPASEPTAGPAGNAVAALEFNVYDGMAKMENQMNARLETIETKINKINTNSDEIHRIATVIDKIRTSLTALTAAVQQVKESISARGG